MADSNRTMTKESIATLAQQITTRRLRLLYLNLLLLLVPIAAIVLFVLFGMSDRKVMTQTIIKEVDSQITAKLPPVGEGAEKGPDSERWRQELEKQKAQLDQTNKSMQTFDFRVARVESYGKKIGELEAGEQAQNSKLALLDSQVQGLKDGMRNAPANVDRLEKAFLAFRSEVLTTLDRLDKGLQALKDVKPDIERVDKAVQALKGLPGSVDRLDKRLGGVEGDLKELRTSTTTRFETIEKARTEQDALLKELSRRLDELGRRLDVVGARALGFVVMREKERKAVPGLGVSVDLGEVESGAVGVKLFKDEKKPLYDSQVQLEKDVEVSDVPCPYRLTVSTVRKANAFQRIFGQRDYLEVHLRTDPSCKTP